MIDKDGWEELTCQDCGNVGTFDVEMRRGLGGSGTYFKFYCSKCLHLIEMDFDNPEYEG